jgi:glycerol uptake facilitator-like aquaporin
MFGEAIFQVSTKARTEPGMWFAEVVATFGLVLTIFGTLRWKAEAVRLAVGLYITSAYWFTASTSFANPAVTLARAVTDTFAGIHPAGVPAFVLAQLAGGYRGNRLFRMAVFTAFAKEARRHRVDWCQRRRGVEALEAMMSNSGSKCGTTLSP